MLDFFYYYIVSTIFDHNYNTWSVKLGITSNPKQRWTEYRRRRPRDKFLHVLKIQCDKKEMLRFETSILHSYEKQNKRIIDDDYKSECVEFKKKSESKLIFNEIYKLALENFDNVEKLSHKEAMDCVDEKVNDDMAEYKESLDGQELIKEIETELTRIDNGDNITIDIVDEIIDEIKDTKENDISINNYFEEEKETINIDEEISNENEFPFELRGYQVDYYDKMVSVMQTNDSLIMNVLPRCGKTILFMKYIFNNRDNIDLAVYIAPRLVLIDEMASRFKHVFGNIYNIVEVSSGINNRVIDINKINFDKKTIILTCIPSFKNFNKVKNKLPNNTVFVFDEAHYLVTNMGDDVNLDDEKNNKTSPHPSKTLNNIWKTGMKKIFSTATPIYGSIRNGGNKAYMNMVNFYGDSRVSFNDIKKATEQKFMVDMKIVIGDKGHDQKDIICDKLNISKFHPEHLVRLIIFTKILDNMYASDKYLYKPNKLLLFCMSIKSVVNTALYLKAYYGNKFKLFVMHSGKTDKENRKALQKYRECKTKCMLINCRMVAAGINIPDIDAVVLIEPRYQKEELVQIIFRPRTMCPTKPNKTAYLIVPQLNSLENSNYDTVTTIMDELVNKNDPAVIRYIEKVHNKRKKISNTSNTTNTESKSGSKKLITTDEESSGIIIEGNNNIESKIIEITKKYNIVKIDTLKKAVLHILNDHIERSAKGIWDEIKSRGIYTPPNGGMTPSASCSSCCIMLYRQGLIKRIENETPYLYYNPKKVVTKITTNQFIEDLKSKNITSDEEYRNVFYSSYNDVYPVEPTDIYKGFSWSLLQEIDEKEYKTINEFKQALSVLENDKKIVSDVKRICGTSKKIQFLKKHDPKIPLHPDKKYNITNLINISKLFRKYSRRR